MSFWFYDGRFPLSQGISCGFGAFAGSRPTFKHRVLYASPHPVALIGSHLVGGRKEGGGVWVYSERREINGLGCP